MYTKGRKPRFNRNKKKKELVLVFDENARREFLTGFRKRRLQRKAKAAEELKKQVKLERKRIKDETKRMFKKIIQSQKPVPEVSHLLSEEIDMGEHSVTVTEISTAAAAKEQNWIGENQACYEEEEVNDNNDNARPNNAIEGMEVKSRKKEIEENSNVKLKTEKDFKKAIKKNVAQHVKKSKVLRVESRRAQIKNMRRKRREQRKRDRENRKRGVKCKKVTTN